MDFCGQRFPRRNISKHFQNNNWNKKNNFELVGGFNPFEKYDRQIGFIFPRDRGENKKFLKPPPSFLLRSKISLEFHLNQSQRFRHFFRENLKCMSDKFSKVVVDFSSIRGQKLFGWMLNFNLF